MAAAGHFSPWEQTLKVVLSQALTHIQGVVKVSFVGSSSSWAEIENLRSMWDQNFQVNWLVETKIGFPDSLVNKGFSSTCQYSPASGYLHFSSLSLECSLSEDFCGLLLNFMKDSAQMSLSALPSFPSHPIEKHNVLSHSLFCRAFFLYYLSSLDITYFYLFVFHIRKYALWR